MGAGRPLEKLDLDDGWQNEVIELYSAGASDVEVKALIYEIRGSFSNDLWDRWLIDEPEFSETIKVGKMLSEAWWAKSGRVNLKDKDFSYTGWYMNMKNRFGWSDKVQNETNLNVTGIKPIEWVKSKDAED
jgi:hypothetical protein